MQSVPLFSSGHIRILSHEHLPCSYLPTGQRRRGLESPTQTGARHRRAAAHAGPERRGQAPVAGPQRDQGPVRAGPVHLPEPPRRAQPPGQLGLLCGPGPHGILPAGCQRAQPYAAGDSHEWCLPHRCVCECPATSWRRAGKSLHPSVWRYLSCVQQRWQA